MSFRRMLFIFIIGSGIFFSGIGFYFFYNIWTFKKLATKTSGTVVEINTTRTKAQTRIYSPVISFYTKEGDNVIYKCESYLWIRYKIGEKVEIIYSENNPSKILINRFIYVWNPPMLVTILGFALIAVGFYYYLKR